MTPETRLDTKMILLSALLATAWASAGSVPIHDALTGAAQPLDFARDYVAARARRDGVQAEGKAANDYGATIGVPRVVLLGGPYFIHPPPALLAVSPLARLGFGDAALAWLALSLLALALLAFFLVKAVALDKRHVHLRVALLTLLLLLWPPVLHNLSKGQWSILLAALIAAGANALESDRPFASGFWLGLAASLKTTPLLLLGYLVLRHRKAALAMVATIATTAALSLAASGWEPWRAWFADVPRDIAVWQTWTANTLSVGGALGRLFTQGPFAMGIVAAPDVSRALTLLLSFALVGAAALITRRAPATAQNERTLFAAWMLLAVVLNPLAWTHTAVLALLPVAILARASASAIPAATLIVLTIPRETLAALAGPIPVRPFAGLALSLHVAAVLALFVFALSRPFSTPSAAPLARPSPG